MSEFFSWDDELDTDVDEYPVLMPGTYPYEVKKVETGTWDKPGKMDGCPYAELTLLIDDKVQTTERLWLKEDLKFKIAEFLTSVSMKEKGKGIAYSKILDSEGRTGMCTVECQAGKEESYRLLKEDEVKPYMEAGNTVYNKVKKFLKPKKEDTVSGFNFD